MTPITHWLACGEAEPPHTDEWLSERDRARLGSMRYTKRHLEARLSRWTAQRAVAIALGLGDSPAAAAQVTITNASDGSPRAEVPGRPPVSISSTDRAGWAVAAVLPGSEPIGCDLEIVEPRSDAFVRDYLTETERRFVENGPLHWEVSTNLIWSAKESVLKVLRTGLRRDTRSVEVTLGSGNGDWHPLSASARTGEEFTGWWRRFGPFLLTVASANGTPPPVSLVEPSPLDSAEPVHSWLERPTR